MLTLIELWVIVWRRTDVQAVGETTIRKSAEIALRYQLSNWDSLIIAEALLAKCDILYSVNMQHNQVIEGQLTILILFIKLGVLNQLYEHNEYDLVK